MLNASDTVSDANASDSSIITPELLSSEECSRICGCSRRKWDRLVASQKTPAPVILGHRRCWRRKELLSWIEAGCPDQQSWGKDVAGAKEVGNE